MATLDQMRELMQNEFREIIKEELKILNIDEKVNNAVKTAFAEKEADLKAEIKAEIKNEIKSDIRSQVKIQLLRCLPLIDEQLKRQVMMLQDQHREILDLQIYTRKRNLIVEGIPEKPANVEETFSTLVQDVTEIFTDMEVDGAILDDMKITAIHRLGSRNNSRPRNVVLVFNKNHHVGAVMSKGKNLKNTNYSVRTHLPAPLAQYRATIARKRKDMITADRNRHVRVIEIKGIPHLQEKTGRNWETLEDFYNQPPNEEDAESFSSPISNLIDTMTAEPDDEDEDF